MKHPVLSAFFLQDGSEQRPKTPIFTGHSFGIDELEYSAAQGNLLKGIENKTVRRFRRLHASLFPQ